MPLAGETDYASSSQKWALNLKRGGIWFAGLISPITATLAAVFLTRKLLLQTKCIAAVKAHLRTARKSASAKKMQQVVHVSC